MGGKVILSNNSFTFDAMGQFVMIPHSFIKDATEMSHQTRWLYIILAFFRNNNTGHSFPSYDTIREISGLTRQKISDGYKDLIRMGWIRLVKRRFGSSNIYEVFTSKHGVNKTVQKVESEGFVNNDVAEYFRSKYW